MASFIHIVADVIAILAIISLILTVYLQLHTRKLKRELLVDLKDCHRRLVRQKKAGLDSNARDTRQELLETLLLLDVLQKRDPIPFKKGGGRQ